jgi:hypothetical protein
MCNRRRFGGNLNISYIYQATRFLISAMLQNNELAET